MCTQHDSNTFSKVSGHTPATYLNRTRFFEWFVVERGSKNGHPKRNVSREDWTTHDPYFFNYSRFNIHILGGVFV